MPKYVTEIHDTESNENYIIRDKNAISMQNLLDAIYPVGCIYTSVSQVSSAVAPSQCPIEAVLGGTWEKIYGKFLLSADSEHAIGTTGGEETHTLTINEMPSHSHTFIRQQWYSADTVAQSGTGSIYSWKSGAGTGGNTSSSYRGNPTDAAGGGAAHNNMPPYLTVYMWKRTA